MSAPTPPAESRRWRPLSRVPRRVLGVLVEKSKTTPDVYPMTLSGITTACNQKSNRSPLMTLEQDEVQRALDDLRSMGAVLEVHCDGRVPKYKHQLYEWMGIERAELAVMAELLLRGHQTLGDLRARASRMEEISDLGQLRQILDRLLARGLVWELTPAGRGQMVSHALYLPEEHDKVRAAVEAEKGLVADEPAESTRSGGAAAESATRGVADRGVVDRLSQLEQQMAEVLARLQRLES